MPPPRQPHAFAGGLAGHLSARNTLACLFRALAEHDRGDRAAARQALDEAVKQLPPAKLDLLEHTPLPWADHV